MLVLLPRSTNKTFVEAAFTSSLREGIAQADRREIADNSYPELGWRGHHIKSDEERDELLGYLEEVSGNT